MTFAKIQTFVVANDMAVTDVKLKIKEFERFVK